MPSDFGFTFLNMTNTPKLSKIDEKRARSHNTRTTWTNYRVRKSKGHEYRADATVSGQQREAINDNLAAIFSDAASKSLEYAELRE